ncbi:MAG: carbohydrate ABC transporter permease [Clostridia bacterium]|nr:carbohydrate ABC transporter permease [Clostridia bacterium]
MGFKTSRRNKIKQRGGGEIAVFTVASVIFFIFALTYIVAFLWGVIAGFKTHSDLILNPFSFPESWHPENYLDVFSLLEVNGVNMLGMVLNSFWLVAGGATLSVFGATFMAYAVTKFDFFGKKFLVVVNIIIMTLPIIGALPSRYRLFSAFGFINSPTILLAYFGGFGAFNLYMCAFFRGVSPTYSEAAKIDGANDFVILFRIMLPLAKGILTALLIMEAVSIWNDYNTALVYMPKLPTLATGIYLFNTEMTYRARMDILMAATIISALPPMILYGLGHKSILKNVSLGGIKG